MFYKVKNPIAKAMEAAEANTEVAECDGDEAA